MAKIRDQILGNNPEVSEAEALPKADVKYTLRVEQFKEIKCVRTKDVIAVPGLGTISTLILKEEGPINHLQGGCLCDSIIQTPEGVLFVESKGKKQFLFFNAILSHIEYK